MTREVQMSDNEIKPCPFCGGEAQLYGYDYINHGCYTVCCKEPDCGCEISGNETTEAARAAWNNRADDQLTAAIAERDAAQEKLERVIRETGWHPLKRWRGSLTDAQSPDDGRNAVLAGDPGDKVDNLREALQTLLSWESGDD